MTNDEPIRRDVLQAIAAAPFLALLAQAATARAQVGVSPVKVDTKGLVAKIRFEAPLEGFLKEDQRKVQAARHRIDARARRTCGRAQS